MAQEYEAVQAATPLLNCINRLVRTRMPGGVAGARLTAAPYADQGCGYDNPRGFGK